MDLIAVGLLMWDSYGTQGFRRIRVKLKVLKERKECQISKAERKKQCPIIYKVLSSLEDKGYLNA